MAQKVSDRREDLRFLVDGNSVAVLGPLPEGLGHVIELSVSGFSFRCDDGEIVPREMEENLTLFGFETVCLGKVRMTTVSDKPICDDKGEIISRRLGVRFDSLSPGQREQLKNFIYNNAYIELTN